MASGVRFELGVGKAYSIAVHHVRLAGKLQG